MSRLRPGVKRLVLCALALGLIVIGISVAQAEVGAKWTVVNKAGELVEAKKSGLSPSLQVVEIENKDLTLLTKLFGVESEILCTGAQVFNARLEGEGKVSSGTTLKFTGCGLIIEKMPSCSTRFGSELGVILSEKLKGLLALHDGSGILRLEPIEKTLFARIEFEKECGLKEMPIQGILTLRDSQLETELQNHLFVQGPLTELSNTSSLTKYPVTLDGSMVLALGGEHVGLKWSGTPG